MLAPYSGVFAFFKVAALFIVFFLFFFCDVLVWRMKRRKCWLLPFLRDSERRCLFRNVTGASILEDGSIPHASGSQMRVRGHFRVPEDLRGHFTVSEALNRQSSRAPKTFFNFFIDAGCLAKLNRSNHVY